MSDAIKQRKLEESTYLREIQQEKAAKKRELMAQQQEELTTMRKFYKDELNRVEYESADAVNHIKTETNEMTRDYAEQRRQQAIDLKIEQQEARNAQREEDSSYADESSAEQKSLYNRQGQRKPMIQNYETKETDDFYRVQNRGSRITEDQKQYVIEAYAPEHEKDNLRVSVQKNKAVVSGKRKFGDEVQEGNKKMRTNNFQTFREEFKFKRPVSHEGMTRERVGDYVKFTIPKLEAIDTPEES
jgi:HSP20 family molecular chaperone IbpA